MPQPRNARRFTGIKFDPDMYDALVQVATAEGWTWDRGGPGGAQPSVSEAARRLIGEALDQRNGGARLLLSEKGLAWIDAEADREGVSRDQMVKVLLAEAQVARDGKRKTPRTDRKRDT